MSIGAELLRYQRDQRFFIWDKETEGLNLYYSRPWQVAWAVGTLDKNEISEDLYPFFQDLKVSKKAAQVTRFDYSEYKSKAIDPLVVLEKFEKDFLNPNVIKVGQNIFGLDIYIYIAFRRSLGLPISWEFLYKNMWIDTNNIAKARKKGITVPPVRNINESLLFNFKMSGFHERTLKTNLTHQGKEFGIEFDYSSTHRGNNDIILNKLVLKKHIWEVPI